MAIDSAAKRYSMLNLGRTAPPAMLFEVDSSVDADDRSHLLGLYGGIALGEPVVEESVYIPVHAVLYVSPEDNTLHVSVDEHELHVSPEDWTRYA